MTTIIPELHAFARNGRYYGSDAAAKENKVKVEVHATLNAAELRAREPEFKKLRGTASAKVRYVGPNGKEIVRSVRLPLRYDPAADTYDMSNSVPVPTRIESKGQTYWRDQTTLRVEVGSNLSRLSSEPVRVRDHDQPIPR